MNNFFDNQRILDLIWKRRFHFMVVATVALLLSAIFSGPAFITPKFKSTARIYPTNIWTLSDESETEQMLEVLNSNDIKLRMFEAFRLDTVYKVDRNDPNYLTYMFDIYNTNVSIKKTEYETAEIKVLDEDPKRAAAMCDSIIAFYNDKVREMHRAKEKEMVEIAESALQQKSSELEKTSQKLDSMRAAFGIISFMQYPVITEGYVTALASGKSNSADVKKIKTLYDNLAKNGSKAQLLELQYKSTLATIDSLQQVKEKHLVEYNKKITYSHVVEYPFPADKKSYPVRWIIVLFSVLSAVFLALLVFSVLDYQKQ